MKKAASLYNHPNNHKSASIGLIQENISVQSLYLVKEHSAKLLQSRPTLCDPIDGSPPGSRVPGILQARTLEWVAISFSNVWKWKVKVKSLSRVRLLATPWTAAYQAPPSMGFSRQKYWSGVPLTSPQRTLGRILKKMHTQGLIFNINYYFFYCFIESILTWNFFFFLNWVHVA